MSGVLKKKKEKGRKKEERKREGGKYVGRGKEGKREREKKRKKEKTSVHLTFHAYLSLGSLLAQCCLARFLKSRRWGKIGWGVFPQLVQHCGPRGLIIGCRHIVLSQTSDTLS